VCLCHYVPLLALCYLHTRILIFFTCHGLSFLGVGAIKKNKQRNKEKCRIISERAVYFSSRNIIVKWMRYLRPGLFLYILYLCVLLYSIRVYGLGYVLHEASNSRQQEFWHTCIRHFMTLRVNCWISYNKFVVNSVIAEDVSLLC
jgi:hypothetical protein